MTDLYEGCNTPPFVYFLRNLENGAIKIGVSAAPERRKLEIARVERVPVSALALVGGVQDINAFGLERLLHDKLRAHRIRGEWFADCADVNAALCDIMREPRSLYEEEFA